MIARLGLVLLFAATSVVAGACSSTPKVDSAGAYVDDHVDYAVAPPGAGWTEMSVDDANGAWFSEEHRASLLVNSHCEGVEDAPLEALTRHLSIGMTEREVLKEERVMLSRREALVTELQAKLDGVPRQMLILVMKKDGCVYDIVLDAAPESFDGARPAFEAMKDTLEVRARPDAPE